MNTQTRKQNLISNLTITDLCEWFIRTNSENKKETPILRGWIMDELEERNPAAFEAWMLTDDIELIENPTSFFIK